MGFVNYLNFVFSLRILVILVFLLRMTNCNAGVIIEFVGGFF